MSKFKFGQKAQKFRLLKSVILEKMANNAVVEFKVNAFDKRALDGKTWKPNKVQEGRQQLVQTGRMRESITILKRNAESVTVGSNVPYAVYHNEGTKHLPQRKFIGNSKVLELKNKALIYKELNKIV